MLRIGLVKIFIGLALGAQSWAETLGAGGDGSVARARESAPALRCEGRASSASISARRDLLQLVQNRAAVDIERDVADVKKNGANSRVFNPPGGTESAELERIRNNMTIDRSGLQMKRDYDPCKDESPFEFRAPRGASTTGFHRGPSPDAVRELNRIYEVKFNEEVRKRQVKTYQDRVREEDELRKKRSQDLKDTTPASGRCSATTLGSYRLMEHKRAFTTDSIPAVKEYVDKLRDTAREQLATANPYLMKIAKSPDKSRAEIQAEHLKELEESAQWIRKQNPSSSGSKAFALYRTIVDQVIKENPGRAAEFRAAAEDMTCELEAEARQRGLITAATGLAVLGCAGVSFFVPPAGAGCFYAASAVHVGTSTHQYLASSHAGHVLDSARLHTDPETRDPSAILKGKEYQDKAGQAALETALTAAPAAAGLKTAATGLKGVARTEAELRTLKAAEEPGRTAFYKTLSAEDVALQSEKTQSLLKLDGVPHKVLDDGSIRILPSRDSELGRIADHLEKRGKGDLIVDPSIPKGYGAQVPYKGGEIRLSPDLVADTRQLRPAIQHEKEHLFNYAQRDPDAPFNWKETSFQGFKDMPEGYPSSYRADEITGYQRTARQAALDGRQGLGNPNEMRGLSRVAHEASSDFARHSSGAAAAAETRFPKGAIDAREVLLHAPKTYSGATGSQVNRVYTNSKGHELFTVLEYRSSGDQLQRALVAVPSGRDGGYIYINVPRSDLRLPPTELATKVRGYMGTLYNRTRFYAR